MDVGSSGMDICCLSCENLVAGSEALRDPPLPAPPILFDREYVVQNKPVPTLRGDRIGGGV